MHIKEERLREAFNDPYPEYEREVMCGEGRLEQCFENFCEEHQIEIENELNASADINQCNGCKAGLPAKIIRFGKSSSLMHIDKCGNATMVCTASQNNQRGKLNMPKGAKS